MRLHYLQHVHFESPGYILEWAEAQGADITSTHFYQDDYALPTIDDFDFLVVMGGPMGVYDGDEYPWIKEEKQFIADVIAANKPVLGICLGAQFIANALNAKVYQGTKEIGWYPVEKIASGEFLNAFPSSQTVMHWHGDTFDLPEGATLLASNDVTKHQAFEYKNCVALQFHFEMRPDNVAQILENAENDLTDDPYVQSKEDIENENGYFESNREILFSILDTLKTKIA